MDNWQNLSPMEKFDLLGQLLGMRTAVNDRPPPSSSMPDFREDFAKAKHIVVLTGAGVSAESGVPTFRGAGGYWRKWQAQQVATPESFEENPSRVWEFYHYRREVMASKEPNQGAAFQLYSGRKRVIIMTNGNVAHLAIAECEKRLKTNGRKLVVITQNIDELHKRAGSENIIEIHGNLFTTRCTKCADIAENRDSPICPALAGKGAPEQDAVDANIPVKHLPRCKKDNCGGLLRPHVVWFGESLCEKTMDAAKKELDECDLCLVVGTSSVVYPAAMFAPRVASRGVPVAEFNTEATDVTSQLKYHFQGPAGTHIPVALAKHDTEPES